MKQVAVEAVRCGTESVLTGRILKRPILFQKMFIKGPQFTLKIQKQLPEKSRKEKSEQCCMVT
jgi:hypothetical protein